MASKFHSRQLGYHLDLPDDIIQWRLRLGGFQLYDNNTLAVTSDKFERVFPFLSNVWIRHDGHIRQPPTVQWPFVKHQYRCRFYKTLRQSRGKNIRKKPSTAVESCKTRLTVTFKYRLLGGEVQDEIEQVFLYFVGTHHHDLSTCDSERHNDAIQGAFKKYMTTACNNSVGLALQQWRDDAPSQLAAKQAGLSKIIDHTTLSNWLRTARGRDPDATARRTSDEGEKPKVQNTDLNSHPKCIAVRHPL